MNGDAARSVDEGLRRVVGVPSLVATVVNNTVGGGIFLLPAAVCALSGAAGILSYVVCGAMLAAIALCYVEVGSRITTTGGSYAYVDAAFGPFAGFVINALFFFGYAVVSDAAMLNVLADSLAGFPAFGGVLSNPVARALLFVVLLGGMALVNVRSAKQGVRAVVVLTIIKMVPLLLIVLVGPWHMSPGNLQWQGVPGVRELGATSIVLFFAFGGFETSLNVSGEIRDPKRTIPRGILLSGVVVLVMYLLIQTVSQGVLGSRVLGASKAPLAAVAEQLFGAPGAFMLIAAAIVSCVANTSGDVLASSRLLFAGARDGLFPKYLARVHPRFATPHWAVVTYSALILVFAVVGDFAHLAMLASGALLLIYLAVVLAMVRLRIKQPRTDETAFRVPGGFVVAGVATVTIVWLLCQLPADELRVLAIFLAAASVLHLVMNAVRGGGPSRPSG